MSSIRGKQLQLLSGGLSKTVILLMKKKILNIKLKANHGHNHKLGVTNCYFHELIRSQSTTPECKLISVWIIKEVIKLILF